MLTFFIHSIVFFYDIKTFLDIVCEICKLSDIFFVIGLKLH